MNDADDDDDNDDDDHDGDGGDGDDLFRFDVSHPAFWTHFLIAATKVLWQMVDLGLARLCFGGTFVHGKRDFKITTFYWRDFKTSGFKHIILFN